MVTHLFPKSQFTEEYVDFINNHFENRNHTFVLYTNKPFELSNDVYKYKNVYDYDEHSLGWLFSILKKSERIILHNLGLPLGELVWFWIFPTFASKSIWLIWGADLYCYLNPHENLADRVVERIRRSVIRRFPVIASLTDGDFSLAKQWYGCKGKSIRLDYCEEKTIRLMDKYMSSKRIEDGVVRILVGNSATVTNQHREVLDMLSHLKDENIMLYVPLSYGDMEYAAEIEAYGKRLFGDKFVAFSRYMTREEYYKMLYDIDVGVFNNNRQQGTGNIEALLYFGRKIYIRDDTSMWKEWVEKEGYVLNNIKELESIDAGKIKSQSQERIRVNEDLIRRYFDVNERIAEWSKAFTMPLI